MSFYTPDNFHQAGSVGFVLNKVRNQIAADMDTALKGLHVKAQHIGILMSLLRGSNTTPASLSRYLGVDSGLMTRMLDKLEALGLLVRSRDTVDRRVVNLQLTAVGQATALRITELAPDVLNARLRNFSEAEYDELRRLLHKLLND
ncbi:MarR family winged helix-turn-helix transcriptional regulator [Paraburkholderia humisilvae]|uniref:Multiple antibiotic resistance protein MarR n=1 Tax=Paraburkholderia humisilvae TaxID=627669 RepID=A0A6J5DSR3_9BURK|nr:MarR family winged helix-turn-helix transcriptional regulator [Paraburkholderia humisilvae]CAB3756351.1 Multiple antibiotic resistance protein MarR [Paraburkholderia humisilvae]